MRLGRGGLLRHVPVRQPVPHRHPPQHHQAPVRPVGTAAGHGEPGKHREAGVQLGRDEERQGLQAGLQYSAQLV